MKIDRKQTNRRADDRCPRCGWRLATVFAIYDSDGHPLRVIRACNWCGYETETRTR